MDAGAGAVRLVRGDDGQWVLSGTPEAVAALLLALAKEGPGAITLHSGDRVRFRLAVEEWRQQMRTRWLASEWQSNS